jgi:hypothetical protein|tara:strand:+ start:309 stop:638 length:330 start_codon:yes stop_codon:yes gene_type:complete
MAIKKQKKRLLTSKKELTVEERLKSIDINLTSLNEFLQGEFWEKFDSLDWKIWEMHQKQERQDKMLEILEDLKSLLRVHLMNEGSQPTSVEVESGKPGSVIGKLFKSKK